ncbi:MAG: hypothetical protein ABI977_24555 [Acidobacteriota bacterium]
MTNKPAGPVWQKIGLFAAIAVLLCFFMPWVEMGVSFIKTGMSGWQLATGSGPAGISIPAWPSLLLIPLGMLAIIMVVGMPMIGQRPLIQVQGRQLSLLLVAVGGLSLLVLGYQYFDLNGQFNRNWVGALAQALVTHVFGWMATLIGSGAVLAAGVMELRTETSPAQPPPASNVGSWMDR